LTFVERFQIKIKSNYALASGLRPTHV